MGCVSTLTSCGCGRYGAKITWSAICIEEETEMLHTITVNEMMEEYQSMCVTLANVHIEMHSKNEFDLRLDKIRALFDKYSALFNLCTELKRRMPV